MEGGTQEALLVLGSGGGPGASFVTTTNIIPKV